VCTAQLALYESAIVLEFPKERPVFIRERSSGTYSIMAYFLSKQVVELPILLLLPLMENAIMFWAIGFRHGTFWNYALVYVLTV